MSQHTSNILDDTDPGANGADNRPPNTWTAQAVADLQGSVLDMQGTLEATRNDVKAVHGEIRLLRGEVTARLGYKAIALAALKYGGTAAITLAATYAPQWVPILTKLVEAFNAAGGVQ